MKKRKPTAMTPSFFPTPADIKPRPVKAKKENPAAPWFDAFIKLVGPVTVQASRGRFGTIMKAMTAAGLTPADVARIPEVVGRYAKWRTLDVSTIQSCWVWLVEPPPNIGEPSPLQMAAIARTMNGGQSPF